MRDRELDGQNTFCTVLFILLLCGKVENFGRKGRGFRKTFHIHSQGLQVWFAACNNSLRSTYFGGNQLTVMWSSFWHTYSEDS